MRLDWIIKFKINYDNTIIENEKSEKGLITFKAYKTLK